MIESDRDHFLHAARRLAAKDRNGPADPEDIAIELGIGLYEVTELVRRYQDSFDWASVPKESCGPAETSGQNLMLGTRQLQLESNP